MQNTRTVLTKNRELELHPLAKANLHIGNKTNDFCSDNLRWRNFSFFFSEAMSEGKVFLGSGGVVNSEAFLAVQNTGKRLDSFRWVADHAFPRSLRKRFEEDLENYR